VPLCLKLPCPLVHTSYSRYSSNIILMPQISYLKPENAGASLLLRVIHRHLFYAIQVQVFRRLLTVALKNSYMLGRGLSPSEKEDPQLYPNDHQNHQKGQQEECEHSQHGEETSTKGPAALDLE